MAETIQDRIEQAIIKVDRETVLIARLEHKNEYDKIINLALKWWNDGERFYTGDSDDMWSQLLMTGDEEKRSPDNEDKEIDALAKDIVVSLRKYNVSQWLRSIPKDEMQDAINTLFKGYNRFGYVFTKVTYSGEAMDAEELANRWNEANGLDSEKDWKDAVHPPFDPDMSAMP